MNRFFVSSKNIFGDRIEILDKAQVHHIKRVLYLKPKDQVMVFDEKGNEYLCEITDTGTHNLIVLLGKKRQQLSNVSPEKKIKLTIACAIPKNYRIDDIIDKLTQLGVDRIIPLITERVIVKLDSRKEALRYKRWEAIAQSAAEQSQRNSLPVIDEVRELKEVLRETDKFDLKIIPTLGEVKNKQLSQEAVTKCHCENDKVSLRAKRSNLKDIIKEQSFKNILVFIGPEGDFAPEEVSLAVKAGCIPVTLGEQVLRVDTAAIAVTSYILLS